MTLYEKILALYPDLTLVDFAPLTGTIVLQNDGVNDYIANWANLTHPKPTDAQLEAAEKLLAPAPF